MNRASLLQSVRGCLIIHLHPTLPAPRLAVRFMKHAVAALCASLAVLASSQAIAQDAISFEREVRPLLKAHCFECHGEGAKLKGGLDLRLRRLLVEGGDSGPALVPGKSDKSLIVEQVRSQQMPPGKRKLTTDEIAVLAKWIDAGAKTAAPEPATIASGFQITESDRQYWAFQPIRKPAVPTAAHGELVRNPIDAFLLEKLETKKLSFAPAAERRTLIRRASFDLRGLPPTPDEIDAFLADAAPDAYERLIDQFLKSPQYGERWGRHWLDVAGYADSEGYDGTDVVRASAYRYRDYVIRSFNADKPFDQFIHEQLAGDEMVRPPYAELPKEELDKLIATGFLRMGPDGTTTGAELKTTSNQMVADTIQIVSSALLGLTVQCAQCHNHRYDPISQVDYYRMRAVFEPALNGKEWKTPVAREIKIFSPQDKAKSEALEQQAAAVDKKRAERVAELLKAEFDKSLAKVPAELHAPVRQAFETPLAKRTAEQKKLLSDFPNSNVNINLIIQRDKKYSAELKVFTEEAAALRGQKPMPFSIRALTEVPGTIPTTFRFERGDVDQPKEAVTPGHLAILDPHRLPAIPPRDPALPTSGRRLAFAKGLTAPENPLTARVLVNRFWMHHFGKGLVGSTGDFGHLGERPSHPELLDWLASEFMASGWKLKAFHKLVMTSTAYRQSSQRSAEQQKLDPDNRLVGRMPIRRLEAEIVRDAFLAVSGKLNAKAFGPPVPITPDEFGQIVLGVDTRDTAGRFVGKAPPLGDEEFRRSVYVQIRRSIPLTALETFDAAMPTPNCESRNSSTVATQALLLMNSKMIHDYASYFAQRLQKEATGLEKQVQRGWLLAYGQEPSLSDVENALRFIDAQTEHYRNQKVAEPAEKALANFCQALLSSNMFLYVD